MKVHIGSEIEKKYQESGLKIAVFAELIDTSDRNVYSLFKREDVNANMLLKVSKALRYNFFQLYQETLPESMLEDTQAEYKTATKKLTVSINVCSTPENYYDNFSSFLKSVSKEAARFGFVLM